MRRIITTLVATVALTGALAMPAAAAPSPASFRIDPNKVCQTYGADGATLTSSNAYGWSCYTKTRGVTTITGVLDLNRWCASAHPGTVAAYGNFDRANSWACR